MTQFVLLIRLNQNRSGEAQSIQLRRQGYHQDRRQLLTNRFVLKYNCGSSPCLFVPPCRAKLHPEDVSYLQVWISSYEKRCHPCSPVDCHHSSSSCRSWLGGSFVRGINSIPVEVSIRRTGVSGSRRYRSRTDSGSRTFPSFSITACSIVNILYRNLPRPTNLHSCCLRGHFHRRQQLAHRDLHRRCGKVLQDVRRDVFRQGFYQPKSVLGADG